MALFPRNKVVQESVNMELTYVFVDDYGNEYDVFAKDGHGSATDWSFLFEEEEWDLDTWSDENIQNTWNIQTTWNNQITQKTWTNSQKTWTNIQKTWWNTKTWTNNTQNDNQVLLICQIFFLPLFSCYTLFKI